jgi:hypothetical protein
VTVGIDLSVNDDNTGIVKVTRKDQEVERVNRVEIPTDDSADPDEQLARMIDRWIQEEGAIVAIDVPFGWPRGFPEAVRKHAATYEPDSGWTKAQEPFPAEKTRLVRDGIEEVLRNPGSHDMPGDLLLRATDQVVRTLHLVDECSERWDRDALKDGIAPFSSVANLITITMMRLFRIWRHLTHRQPLDGPADGLLGALAALAHSPQDRRS